MNKYAKWIQQIKEQRWKSGVDCLFYKPWCRSSDFDLDNRFFVDYKDLVLRFIIVTNTKFYTVGSCASPARNNFTELLQPLERVNTCC